MKNLKELKDKTDKSKIIGGDFNILSFSNW